MLQKLHASLEDKELSPETGISASDEFKYESAVDTFEQYGDSIKYIDQINTHGYHGEIHSLGWTVAICSPATRTCQAST